MAAIRTRFALIMLLTSMTMAGCASGPPKDFDASRGGPCPADPGGWCGFSREIAAKVWPYAQMSTRAYRTGSDNFVLPSQLISRHKADNDDIGFAYEIFDRYENGTLVEVIVAFRGTENFADWWYGNLLGRQNRRGVDLVAIIFDQLDNAGYSNVTVTVTGHSLGGGIAHHVSLRELPTAQGLRTVARSYVFNNSPRYWRPRAAVDRIAVVERGEALTLLRWPANEATQRHLSVNCYPGFNPIGDHRMRKLADCITWIAAFDDPGAQSSLQANPAIGKPPGQINDDHPIPTQDKP